MKEQEKLNVAICDFQFLYFYSEKLNVMRNRLVLTDEAVVNKIYFIRGNKVMTDRDLADMYRI